MFSVAKSGNKLTVMQYKIGVFSYQGKIGNGNVLLILKAYL